jgi:hypothetical protein
MIEVVLVGGPALSSSVLVAEAQGNLERYCSVIPKSIGVSRRLADHPRQILGPQVNLKQRHSTPKHQDHGKVLSFQSEQRPTPHSTCGSLSEDFRIQELAYMCVQNETRTQFQRGLKGILC